MTKKPIRDKQSPRNQELAQTEHNLEQAKEALRQSEQLLSRTYNSAGVVLFDLSVEPDDCFRFQSINQLFLDATGLAKDQVVGKRIEEVIPEPSVWMVRDNYKKAISEKRTVRWEEISEYPAGVKVGEVSVTPFFDNAGICTHLTGSVHDITERRSAEQSLQESEERYRVLVENVPSVLWSSDEVGRTTFISPNVSRVYGYTNDEVYRGGEAIWFGRIHPEDVKRVKEKYADLFKNGSRFNVEYRIRHKNGHWIWLHDHAEIVYSKSGQRFAYGVFTDITQKVQIQQALQESELHYRTLFESASDAIFLIEEDRIVECNQKVLDLFARTREQILNRAPWDFSPSFQPDGQESTEKARQLSKSLERGNLQFFEWRHRRPDGSQFDVEVNLSALNIKDQKQYIAIVRDISERKQADEALHKALTDASLMKEIAEKEQAFTKMALDAQRDTFFVFELATNKLVRWNKAFSERSGYTDEEIASMKAPDDLFSPEELPKAVAGIERILKGKSATAEMELITKEGRRIPTEYVGSLIRDEQGDPKYIIAIGRDITKRKKANERLRNSEQEQRNLIENMPIACFKFDQEGNILSWNRAAEEIYGYTKEEAIGRNAYDLIVTPTTKEKTDQTIREVFLGKTVKGTEWQDRNKSGEIGWRIGNNFPLLSTGGEVKYGVNLNIDITEKKRAEQRLNEAYQEIQQLNEQIRAENVYLQQEIRMSHLHGDIVGHSDAIKSVMAQAEQVAVTDSTVLVLGETGTGKELLARAIHNMSSRRKHPFMVVNCAAIPESLVESELFGREKGAYTGADTRRIGRFEIANGSTIFLDEIAELSMDIQGKLLRVLQEGQIERLGGTQTIDIDVRVIAATNRDLEKEIESNRFREDLYYRLNVFPITIPPLRERRKDIPELVRHFVNEMSPKMGKKIEKIPHQSIGAMQKHAWPGNVRELHNVIERAMIQTQGTTLRVGSLAKLSAAVITGRTLNEVQRQHILDVLERTGWRVSGKNGAADVLGLKPTTLESKLAKLGIKRPGRISR